MVSLGSFVSVDLNITDLTPQILAGIGVGVLERLALGVQNGQHHSTGLKIDRKLLLIAYIKSHTLYRFAAKMRDLE